MTALLNPEAPRPGLALGLTWAPTRPPRPMYALPQQTGRPSGGPRNSSFFFSLKRQEEKPPRRLGPGRGRETGQRGGQARQDRAAERPGARERSPPQTGPRPAAAVYRSRRSPGDRGHGGTRSPAAPSPSADPPHLDLPTPLSPMMRIFRVVSTSSSILTLLGSEPSRPGLTLNSFPGRAARACALLGDCHLFTRLV